MRERELPYHPLLGGWLRRLVEGERHAEKPERLRQCGLAASHQLELLQLGQHARQRQRIVQRMVRPAERDSEPFREMLQLGALVEQRACEWKGVEEPEVIRPAAFGREPAEHRDIETLTVVRHQQVRAYKRSESEPDLGKGRRVAQILVAVAVNGARLGADRARAPHQLAKLGD